MDQQAQANEQTLDLGEDFVRGLEAIGQAYGIDAESVRYWIRQGHIPAFKLLGKWTVRRSTVLKDIEAREAVALGRVAEATAPGEAA